MRVVRVRDAANVTVATLLRLPIYSTWRAAIVARPVTRTSSLASKGPIMRGSPSTTPVIKSPSQVATADGTSSSAEVTAQRKRLYRLSALAAPVPTHAALSIASPCCD